MQKNKLQFLSVRSSIIKSSPCKFQANTLASGEGRQRASVRMSQYLQSWRTIHPFADLSNPDASPSKKPVIPTNCVMNQSQLSAVCICAANATHHLCSFVCPSPVFDYNVYAVYFREKFMYSVDCVYVSGKTTIPEQCLLVSFQTF